MRTRVFACWAVFLCLVADTTSDTTVAPDAPTAVPTGVQGPERTSASQPEMTGIITQTDQTLVLAKGITLDPGDVVITGGDTGGDVDAFKTVAPPGTQVPGGGGGGTTQADGVWSSETATAGQVADDSTATQADQGTVTQGETEAGDVSNTTSDASTTLPPVAEVGTTAETAAATTKGVTEPAAEVTTGGIATTLRPWPEDDPCHESQHTLLKEDARHFSRKGAEGSEALSDSELEAGWYAFSYQEEAAIITSTCIKERMCSTIMPYHLKTDSLPEEIGETIQSVMCGPGKVAGGIDCCLKPVNIEIRNCQTHYIFKLEKVPLLSASICTQLKDEVVPPIYHAIPPSEQTTPAVDTTPQPTLPWVEYNKDDAGIVTVEYTFSKEKQESNYLIEEFDLKFRQMIAEALNNITDAPQPTVVIREGDELPGGGGAKKTTPDQVGPKVPDVDTDAGMKGPEDMRRRRNAGETVYTADDVKYVGMTPTTTGETLQVPIYVEDPDTERVPTDKMMAGLKNLEDSGQISDDVGVPMIRYYEGLPEGISPVGRRTDAGMWDRHRDLLIALIVLISLCLLIILIGLLCLRCRKSRGSWSRDDDKVAMEAGYSGKKRPLVQENPLSDKEIMKDEASMVERDNPAMTSNGGGGHLSKKDDDNGWVVPIDELSSAEKEKPEVEDTKL